MEHLTKETFLQKVFNYEKNTEWKFAGELPCIIDFYADWCGPCKMVAPILEDLSKDYRGKINIYKVNTEEQQELASVFGIRSIPSILFCPRDENLRWRWELFGRKDSWMQSNRSSTLSVNRQP